MKVEKHLSCSEERTWNHVFVAPNKNALEKKANLSQLSAYKSFVSLETKHSRRTNELNQNIWPVGDKHQIKHLNISGNRKEHNMNTKYRLLYCFKIAS